MILDTLANAARYTPLHSGFKTAFKWLQETDLARLPNGRTEIDGDRIYASVMREPGRGQAAARFETHRRYIDIQYIVEGADLMGWVDARGLTGLGYDTDKDLEFHEGRPELWIPVPAGTFTVFFPEDAHAPMASTVPMLKIVVKVAV